MKKNKSLAKRMKKYEHNARFHLLDGLPILVRIDGKNFSNYTKGMKKPFDEKLAKAFWETCKYLGEKVPGCRVIYHQSDEISLFLNYYESLDADGWFDNNIQKLASVLASYATAKFNEEIHKYFPEKDFAIFDARVWALPEKEVTNYFIWRQRDATKNSISMVAQSKFSQNELQGLKGNELQDKLFTECGINWNDLPVWQKRGMCIVKTKEPKEVIHEGETIVVERNTWKEDEKTPIFSKEREYIEQYV